MRRSIVESDELHLNASEDFGGDWLVCGAEEFVRSDDAKARTRP